MSAGRIDPNLLAAFLEDRLSPEERRRVIEQLNASPEDYEIFAEAAGLLGDLEGSTEPSAAPAAEPVPQQRPLTAERRQWWIPRPWMLVPLAAAVAVVVLARPGSSDADFDDMLALAEPSAVVSATGPGAVARELGADWSVTGWSVMRGGDSSGSAQALEFRIGARMADLQLALDRADDTAVQLIAGELASLLDQVQGGGAAAQQLAALSRQKDARTADAAREAVGALLGRSAALRLGIWAEHARIAAAAGNVSYFSRDAMSALRSVADEAPAASAHVPSIEAAAAAGDMSAMTAAITALMRASGG